MQKADGTVVKAKVIVSATFPKVASKDEKRVVRLIESLKFM
jgi:hypothetical protein